MKKIVYIVLMCFALFMSSCNNNPQPPQRTDKYSLDSLICLADKSLNAASLRIMEGEQNGQITPFESANLHANITYKFTENYSLAMDFCQQALSYLTEEDYVLQVYTYYLLATIASDGQDYYSCLNACSEGRNIAKKHNMKFKEYSFDYISGKCNLDMGYQNEALKSMSSAIDKSVKVVELESEYKELISFVNDLISNYMTIGDMKNVVREAKVLSMLTDELEAKYPHTKAFYERRALQNAENNTNNLLFIIIALFLVVVLVIVAFVIIYRLNKRKTPVSAVQLEEIQKQMLLIASEKSTQSEINETSEPQINVVIEKPAKKSLSSLVEGEKLFLDQDISRVQVIQMLGCSHKTLTMMLNDIQPNLSFPDYIKGLRVDYAVNLIKENPKLNVKQVAEQSGFSSISSFERSFKSITGKNPKEFMKNQNY